MKSILTSLLLMTCLTSWAQLPEGSFAPDFTAMDIDSVEHNLYSYLDSGYQVILDFSATWCGPCWNYHTSGVLEELYEAYGPDGTNEIRVFFIEGDDSTTSADLQGTGTSTAGDWITGTSYPIIDNAGDIFATFENTYYPTIYTVCPSGLITESGQATVVGHEAVLQSATCAPASFPNDGLLVGYAGDDYSCGDNLANLAVRLMNQGLDTLTSCSIQVSRQLPFNQTEVIGTYDWTGSLATYEVTTAELTGLAIDAQTLFNFDIVSADDNPGNNSTIGEVLKSEEIANNIEIRLFTDMNPEETSWVLENAAGDVITEVDAGTEISQGQTEYIWDVTLPDLGCYSLTLMDLAGDGHIGGALSLDGVGSLTVSSMDGETTLEQELFFQTTAEFSEVRFEFEASSITHVTELDSDLGLVLYPNPTHGPSTLEFHAAQSGAGHLFVRNVLGASVLEQSLGNLPAGTHRLNLDLGFLVPGAYMVDLQMDNVVHTLRLLKD